MSFTVSRVLYSMLSLFTSLSVLRLWLIGFFLKTGTTTCSSFRGALPLLDLPSTTFLSAICSMPSSLFDGSTPLLNFAIEAAYLVVLESWLPFFYFLDGILMLMMSPYCEPSWPALYPVELAFADLMFEIPKSDCERPYF